MIDAYGYILPDWPAPDSVAAAVSTRIGGANTDGALPDGISTASFAGNNLALHVGDDARAVQANRTRLREHLQLACEPQWLEQIHGVKVVNAQSDGRVRTADAAITDNSQLACAVLTADCLPILLCDRAGAQVAALHAGWRGLARGIVPRTVARFNAPSAQLIAWLGPAISVKHFEVGIEVVEAFFKTAQSAEHSDAIADAIQPGTRPMHFYADIYQLARAALQACGVNAIYGGDFCTFSDPERFYSYRRDGKSTGRMASLIWRT